MLLLPKKIGALTLMRRLPGEGTSEVYAAILDSPAGKQVRVHRLAPSVVADPALTNAVRARATDLQGQPHPLLAPIVDVFSQGDDLFIVQEWSESVGLDALIAARARAGAPLPAPVFLHLAAQACNAIDALHARPARATGGEAVLHLAIRPSAFRVHENGSLTLDDYGWLRSPTDALGLNLTPELVRWLAPEQVQADGTPTTATDLFSLGGVFCALLNLEPPFAGAAPREVIDAIQRGNLDGPLAKVGAALPGLERVLFRAMSANPRHRYPRAFVLREDLRGLMASYSFANIEEEARAVLAEILGGPAQRAPGLSPGLGTLVDLLDAPPRGAVGTSTLVPDESVAGSYDVPAPMTDEVPTHSGVSEVPDWSHAPPLSMALAAPDAPPPAAAQPAPAAPPPRPAPAPRPPAPDDEEDDDRRGGGGAVVAAGAFAVFAGLGVVALLLVGGGALWWMTQSGTGEPVTSASVADGGNAGRPQITVEQPPAEPSAADPSAPAEIAPAAASSSSSSSSSSPRASSTPSSSSPPSSTPSSTASVRATSSPRPAYVPPAPMPPVRSATASRPAKSAELAAFAPAPLQTAAEVTVIEQAPGTLADLGEKARAGKLAAADIERLEGLRASDADFTRANVILYQNAKAKDDNRARARYLAEVMSVPENQYNPQFLVEEAELAIRKKDWNTAIAKADNAERHWARLPSDLIFSRKAMIYEIQAGAWQGRFYDSDGTDMEALQQAIRAWDKYLRHVQTKNRADLAVKGETQAARLRDMQSRLE